VAAPDIEELGGWPAVLSRVVAPEPVPPTVVTAGMESILSGTASASQIAAFAVGLRTRRETPGDVAAALAVMERHGIGVPLTDDERMRAICTCGTGGDRSGSINISTIAAFVVAGAGATVCKHGGRAASSLAGSADVLEALGVAVEITPEGVADCVRTAGFGFCFAPRFHPAMRHAGPVRRELGIRTIFNILGPLANPGRVMRQLVGVSDLEVGSIAAEVLRDRGARAAVVHGDDGLDEITTTAPTTVRWVLDGDIRDERIDPARFGLRTSTTADLRGGDPAHNAEAARRVLAGEHGPHRDIVVLNAAAALVIAGRTSGLEDGLALAAASIDSGASAAALERMVATSKRHRIDAAG
jgi:anthranilate phosphoribosyltransferase